MAMSQQEVIKKFMASLDKTTKSGTAALDEAINAATNGKFKTAQELINQMLADRAKAKNGDDFLKRFCGINLDNADTGAITGADAGGSKIKTSTSVMPNGTFDTSFKQNSFTKRGVTFKLAKLAETYNGSQISVNDLKYSSEIGFNDLKDEVQKHIWQALYSFWAEEALKLIEESYGYSFNDSDAKFKEIRIFFIDTNEYSAKTYTDIFTKNGENYICIGISMEQFQNIDKDDLDGKHPNWIHYYLDRLIAHEFTHAIMNAKIDTYHELPGFIKEGVAELTTGIDDSQSTFITPAVESKDTLAKYLDDKADGLDNEDYVGGYILLRYLARQFGDLNISNGTSSTLVSGFYGNDSIYNSSGTSYVTIDGGAGKDTLYNFQGNYAYMVGGQGDDSIYNKSYYSTINGGDGNDIIINYDVKKTSINGGDGNDIVSLSGINFGEITITGGKGNDTIYTESLTSSNYGILYLYSSGDGNDSITGVSANDTIKIGGAEYEKVTTVSSSDVTLKVGSGSMILKDAKNVSFTIDGTIKPNALNVSNSKSNTLISGTAYNDTVSNSGNNVSISGVEGNDSIYNGSGANYVTLDGGAGNDSLYNFQGNFAYIIGGQGTDSIYNKSWYSTINGGSGNDIIVNYDVGHKTSINGGDGNDIVSLSGINFGEITITGGNGNDTIYTESLASSNYGILYLYNSGDGNDVIYGFTDNDTLKISGTSSTLTSGNDTTVKVGNGSIVLKNYKKAGSLPNGWKYGTSSKTNTNSAILTATIKTATNIDLTQNYGNSVTTVNAATSTAGIIITGNASSTSLKGGKGADTIYGGYGNDTVSLGGGNDIYIYSAGNDFIQDYKEGEDKIKLASGSITSASLSSSNVILKTSNGNITVKNGKGKKITVIDSSGNETTNIYPTETLPAGISIKNSVVTAASTFKGNKINLADYDATKVNAAAVTQGVSIVGTTAANSLKGGKGADTISGGAGNDTVSLGGGNDVYIYSGGNDFIQDYTAGQDKISLASGSITSASLSSSNVILKTSNGNITVKNGKGKKITIIDSSGKETSNIYPVENLPAGISIKNSVVTAAKTFTGKEINLADYDATTVNAAALTQGVSIVGTAAANSLKGGKGADKLYGGSGNDTLLGGSGADSLFGENGNDLLKGEAGNDTLSGGSGNDTLTGGAGNDVFIFSAGKDVITDYAAGDKIKISSGKISKTSYSGNNVIFTIGSGSLTVNSGKGKKITIVDSSGKTTTKTYNSGLSARTLDLLYDNNFITDDTNLDSITEQKFSVTEIQNYNEDFAQDDKTFIAYAEK